MGRTAVVAGSTGLVGKELVHKLLQDDSYTRVVTLVRRGTQLRHAKLTERVVTFDDLQLEPGLLKEADIYCTLGTTMKQAGSQEAFRRVDYDYPIRLAELAVEQGAAQYLIVTAMGSSTRSSFFYSRVKGEVEEKLRTLGFRALHIFQPSLLLGEREAYRPGERLGAAVMKLFRAVLTGPFRKYRAIPGEKVAEAMRRAALSEGRGVHVYESDAIADLAARP